MSTDRSVGEHFVDVCKRNCIITVISVNDDKQTFLIYSELILEDASETNRVAQVCQALLGSNNDIVCTFKNGRRYCVNLTRQIDDDMVKR